MKKKKNFFGLTAVIAVIAVIAIISIGVTSCEGPEGPMGPQGPQGPKGASGGDGLAGADGRPATPVVVYTVTFNTGPDGSAIEPEKLMQGGKASRPEHPTRPFTPEQIFAEGPGLYRTGVGSGWIFLGWYLDGSLYDFDAAVTKDITLTAQWAMPGKISTGSDGINAVPTAADFFDKALDYVIKEPSNYYLIINQDYTSTAVKTATATGITLTIIGIGSERTITANPTNGQLFVINNGATLNLENNITLKGKATASTASLINITNGTLNMNDGSKITGHTTTNASGTITVTGSTSSFVMNDGELSGNRSGENVVVVNNGSNFTMNGGKISGNQTTSAGANGGIVTIDPNSNFIMNDGTITGNTVSGGGCVNILLPTVQATQIKGTGNFTMNGGTITGNTNTNTGAFSGGVFIQNGFSFWMTGGSITGNTGTMGDVYGYYILSTQAIIQNIIHIQGNSVIGTFTVPTNGSVNEKSVAQIKISGNWTGNIQVLNLYHNLGVTFANVYTQYTNRYVVSSYSVYTLTAADIDKFIQVNFMRQDFATQSIAFSPHAIVRSGTEIGLIR
jgi:hypothetical protein